jgi:hypothetical protein
MNIYKESAKARGFYDIPYWSENEPKPIYWELFKWWNGDTFGAGKKAGELNEELFDTLDKKIYYLQGVFEDYSGHSLDKNCINFANSPKKVERCKKWIDEIAREKLLQETFFQGVISHNIKYMYPICHTVEIHPKVIEFIKNYE